MLRDVSQQTKKEIGEKIIRCRMSCSATQMTKVRSALIEDEHFTLTEVRERKVTKDVCGNVELASKSKKENSDSSSL